MRHWMGGIICLAAVVAASPAGAVLRYTDELGHDRCAFFG